MKKLYTLLFITSLVSFTASSQSIFELAPSQSMSITGKGVGQDAAYNPYSKSNSVAIVENIGKNSFVIRVQKKGKIIERISIDPSQTKEVTLLKGYELYLDSELKSKATVNFKRLPE